MAEQRPGMDAGGGGAQVFFDPDCGLCVAAAGFLRRRARPGSLVVLPLDGPEAESARAATGGGWPDSLVWRRGPEVRFRTDALLKAAAVLGGSWGVAARIAAWVPRRWRDGVYAWVARNRHLLWRPKRPPLVLR